MLIPHAGECIGDFELIRRIGAGGMGVVYEARQLSTGRHVALKILSPAMTREKNRVRFMREAEAAARLHHPNIVAVHAIREDAELCYYAMECIRGWPLSRVIEQLGVIPPRGSEVAGQMPLTEFMRTHADQNAGGDSAAETVVEGLGNHRRDAGAARPGQDARPPGRQSAIRNPTVSASYVRQVVSMIRDIARALQYAHSQGVTHRDIKPDNLLMDQEGKLHLVDFGLARVMEEDNLTLTGELMGTPLYMSPEQVAAGRIGIDHRTDLYSLGVVLYHLLCLQPPYEAPTREALLRAIVIHSPPPLSARNPAVPRELETIVHHAMEKDPDRRYASGGELADDLDRWLAGRPISLRTPGPMARWWSGLSQSSRRKAVAASVTVLAFAALLVAVMLWGGRGPSVAASPTPAEAVRHAAQEAASGDYFQSALWYAEAFRRGARPEGATAMQASIVFNALAPSYGRFPLGPGEQLWTLHPSKALCALSGPVGGMRYWDLAAGAVPGAGFALNSPPRWIAFETAGQALWSVQTHEGDDLMQLWNPMGQPIATEPIKVAGRITRLRTAFTRNTAGNDEYTVMVMVRPPATASTPPQGRDLQGMTVYRIRPQRAPVPLRQMSNVRLADLSHDGRWLATLTGDDVFQTMLLTSASSIPIGAAGTTALFSFSPVVEELALAEPTGEIAFKEPRDTARPVGILPDPSGLRPGTAPAYLRFSPDGKYLLVVGTDTEVVPPHRRSVIIINTRSAMRIHRDTVFARDAVFSADSRTVVWWDDEGVTFATCEENQLAERRQQIRVPVRSRPGAPAGGLGNDPSETRHLPVQIDAQARRMLCIEPDTQDHPNASTGRVSAWDVRTGERLRVLLASPGLDACGLDATGRFALVQSDQPRPELRAWDLGGPETPYPASAPLPALPASLDDLRLTRQPLISVLSETGNGLGWSLLDPATLQSVGLPAAAEGPTSGWLISDDAAVLLQVVGEQMRVLDLRSGRWGPMVSLAEIPENVLAISPDGGKVVIGRDSRLTLHGTQTGAVEMELPPQAQRPTRVRFSPSGHYIAVAGQSGRITVHSLEAAGQTVKIDTGQPVRQMEFCLADTLLVAGHTAGAASLWALPQGRLVGRIKPANGPQLPTLVAVRDQHVGSAPPLLATACANRIELRPLPRPSENGSEAQLDPIGPPLETSDGIVALAFPSCESVPAGPGTRTGSEGPAGSQPSDADAVQPCERLLVITDNPAVRWFNLAAHSWAPEQWQREIAARTGMAIDSEGKPAALSR